MDTESRWTCNGSLLTEWQSMTIRFALETLKNALEKTGLGNDEYGKGLTESYLKHIHDISLLMVRVSLKDMPTVSFPDDAPEFASESTSDRDRKSTVDLKPRKTST